MKINKILQTRNSSSRYGSDIKYIVIHYVGQVSSARNNCLYFKNNTVLASAHFFVDKAIWQSVALSRSAWHCGGELQDYGKSEGGATLHGICKNANSIGVELCCTKINGKIVPSPEAIKTAIPLVKWLMKKYNIPASRVVRHFDVTGKCCPNGYISRSSWRKLHGLLTGGSGSVVSPAEKPKKEAKYRKIDRVYRVLPTAGLNVRKSPNGTVLKALPQNAEIRCTLSDRKGWLYCPKYKGWVCFSDKHGKYLKWIR